MLQPCNEQSVSCILKGLCGSARMVFFPPRDMYRVAVPALVMVHVSEQDRDVIIMRSLGRQAYQAILGSLANRSTTARGTNSVRLFVSLPSIPVGRLLQNHLGMVTYTWLSGLVCPIVMGKALIMAIQDKQVLKFMPLIRGNFIKMNDKGCEDMEYSQRA